MATLPVEEWTWRVLQGGVGIMNEDTGVYTAPNDVLEATIVKVLATHRFSPACTAKATLLILPSQPFATLDQVLGPGWMAPFSEELPFMNLATGRRFQEVGRVDNRFARGRRMPVVLGGYGLPITLRWEPDPGTQAQLLSYVEGSELIQSGRRQGILCLGDN
jgi:hypothetical protein